MTDAEVDFVLASNPGLTAFVDRLTIDPDGPGGLSDMDGDGFFDDLPAGESFSLFLKHEVLPEVGCPANRSSGSYKVTTEYTDQCEEDVARVISNAAGNFADFTADGPGSLTGPQDIFDMDVFTVQICGTQRFSGSMVSCPTDTLMLQAEVPSGFSLVSATATRPLGTVEQVEDTIFARVDFADNVLICFDLTLQLDCSEYDGRTPFDFTYRYLCDEACGVEEIFSCPTYNPIIHCPAPCPQGGLTVRSTEAVRATLGFANPLTCEEFADPATLSKLQRQRAQPCDTVCINVKSVQIDGLSRGPDASWDNAYFSIQYDPFNTAANNNLSYAGGTLEIWDASTGNFVVMDCPLPAPDTEENINNAGGENDLHRMNFNLSSCLAGMPGGVLEAGDSVNINLKVYVEKDGALDDDVPTQLPDIFIRTYNLVDTVAQDRTPPDGTLDTVTCDRFSLELYLHETTFGGGGGLTNREVLGCNAFSGGKTFPTSGAEDWYPGEIRPGFKLDSVVIAFSSCDSLDFSSVRLNAEGNPADGYTDPGSSVRLFLGDPDRSYITETGKRYIWLNDDPDNPWPLGDINGRFNRQGGYSLDANFLSSCNSKDGTLTMGFYASRYGYASDPDCLEPNRNNIATVQVNHTNPSTSVADLTGVVNPSTDTVCWTVEIQNAPSVNGGFFFVGFEDNIGPVNVIELLDVAADTLIPLDAYPEGQWAVVDENFPASTAREYKITALLEACGMDSLLVVSGFECAAPPADPSAYACELDSVYLKVEPLESQVQIELAQENGPYDICSVIEDTITVTSALDAFITDVTVVVPLPVGLSESDLIVDVEYPLGSGNIESFPVVIVPGSAGDTAIVSLMQHSVIMAQGGIPGTQDASTAEAAQARIFLNWITSCEFLVGGTYSPGVFANRPCGDPAIDSGVSTTSDPLIINGAALPFLSIVDPELSIDTIRGCMDEEVMVATTIVVGTSTENDTIFVTIPSSVSYVEGSYMCTLTAPADTACAVFGGLRMTDDGRQQMLLKIPDGINGTTEISFEYMIMAKPGGLCNAFGIFEYDVITSAPGVFCPTIGENCPNLSILTGSATDTIFFLKAEPVIDSLSVCTQDGNFVIGGELTNTSVAIPAGETLTVSAFCASDPTTAIGSIGLPGPIAVGETVAFQESLPAVCPEGEGQLYFLISPTDDACICEPVDTLIDIIPEVIVEAGSAQTICQTTSVDLSTLGASITGAITSGSWTGGDGVFSPSATFPQAMVYTPGEADMAVGTVILRLTADPVEGGCEPEFDEVVITILRVDCGSFPWSGN